MVVKNCSPEKQARELMMNLQSSQLHYVTQETPFSLYITVRKKYRENSKDVVPVLPSVETSEANISMEIHNDMKATLEALLKQKSLEFHKLEATKNVIEGKLLEVSAAKTNLEVELDEKALECHELKVTNNIFQEKLQKAEAYHIEFCNTVKQDKDTLGEKIEFLVTSNKRSTEETLSMEKKYIDGKKVTKKLKNEICLLKEELDSLEQANKKFEKENYNLHSEKKFSEPKYSPHQELLSKPFHTNFPTSLEKLPTPSSQQKAPTVALPSDSNSTKSEFLHAPPSNISLERKPFSPASDLKKTSPSGDLHPGKPFPHASELKKTSPTRDLHPGKPFPHPPELRGFPPTGYIDPGKPFPPSQEKNNNFEDLHKEN